MEKYHVERDANSGLSPAEMRDRLERDGYSTFEWADAPGRVYGPHEHATDQSHWIISGCLELTVDGAGTFTLNSGDRDTMPAGTRHSARVVGDEPVRYLIGERRHDS